MNAKHELAMKFEAKVKLNEQTMGVGEAFAKACTEFNLDVEEADKMLRAFHNGTLADPMPQPNTHHRAKPAKISAALNKTPRPAPWWLD